MNVELKSYTDMSLDRIDHRIGLVLDGGGAKGAYQIGVWRALRETGLEKYVTDIAGTSVGGLNAALFVKGDLEEAKSIWENEISSIQLTRIQLCVSELIRKHLPDMSFLGETKEYHDRPMNCFITTCNVSGNHDDYDMVIEDGVIKKIIFGKAVYFNLRALSSDERSKAINNAAIPKDFLLATSALPFLCPARKIEDHYYIDGGLANNSPVYPLLEATKCDTIIVIHLDSDVPSFKKERDYNGVAVLKNEDVSILNIVPSQDAHHFWGTLDFRRETAVSLMELGYRDTKNAFETILENWKIEKYREDSGMFKDIEPSLAKEKYKHLNDYNARINNSEAKVNYQHEPGVVKQVYRFISGRSKKNKEQIETDNVELHKDANFVLHCHDKEIHSTRKNTEENSARIDHIEKFIADKHPEYTQFDKTTSANEYIEETKAEINLRIEHNSKLNEEAIEDSKVVSEIKQIPTTKQDNLVQYHESLREHDRSYSGLTKIIHDRFFNNVGKINRAGRKK